MFRCPKRLVGFRSWYHRRGYRTIGRASKEPTSSDATIMTWEVTHGSTVLTHDLDFVTALTLTYADGPDRPAFNVSFPSDGRSTPPCAVSIRSIRDIHVTEERLFTTNSYIRPNYSLSCLLTQLSEFT